MMIMMMFLLTLYIVPFFDDDGGDGGDIDLVHCELHEEISKGGGQALKAAHEDSAKFRFHDKKDDDYYEHGHVHDDDDQLSWSQ